MDGYISEEKGCGRDDSGHEFRPCKDCHFKRNSKECLEIMKEETFVFLLEVKETSYEEEEE